MKQVHSIRFNFLMNFILTASSFVFPLITFPYVSRVLMPEGIGKVTFATSVISYFTMVAMLGVPTYGIRACAQVRDDKEKLSKVVQELMIINLVLTLICYVCLGISICTIDRFREDSDIIWISSLGILLNAVGVNWFYSAIEEYSYITFRSLIFKVLSVFLMFFCIKDQDDYPMYAVMTLVASSGSYVLNFIRLRKYIFFKRYPHYDFMPHIKAAMVFFAMTVATTVYTNLDTVMLGFMSGDAEVLSGCRQGDADCLFPGDSPDGVLYDVCGRGDLDPFRRGVSGSGAAYADHHADAFVYWHHQSVGTADHGADGAGEAGRDIRRSGRNSGSDFECDSDSQLWRVGSRDWYLGSRRSGAGCAGDYVERSTAGHAQTSSVESRSGDGSGIDRRILSAIDDPDFHAASSYRNHGLCIWRGVRRRCVYFERSGLVGRYIAGAAKEVKRWIRVKRFYIWTS